MQHQCYTYLVPTKHKRHSVTETPRVKAALAELRATAPNERVDLAELVILGAQSKTEEHRSTGDERRRALASLADRVTTGELGIDVEAAEWVRRHGWNPHR